MKSALASLAATLETPPPWWSPYVPLAQQVLHATTSQSVATALNAAQRSRGKVRNGGSDKQTASANSPSPGRRGKVRDGGPPHFVEQSALPVGEPYESFIARTACVPTRDNLHDLFNGLVWLSFPQTKRRLNALQAQQIALHGTTGARGTLRDALTLFDENAAVLRAPAILIDALRLRDWHTLFVEQRAQWRSACLAVFGHALMEKLMQPRKAITAHVWLTEEMTDDALAASINPERLTTKMFLPLPVLGVPGWWTANDEPGFYDDVDVFRPPRLNV